MSTRHRRFDTKRLRLLPLAERIHDLDLARTLVPLTPALFVPPALAETAKALAAARDSGAARILMLGAHVLRSGVQPQIIDLMERGLVDCLSMNGACAIHDFEFALIGATTESVARYIKDGQFGLWTETGGLNEVAKIAARDGLGLGEAVGRAIAQGDFPHCGASVFAAAWRLGIPACVHVGMGLDIVHEHPNCDGAAWGQASYADFLTLAAVMERLEGGVVMNFGSAVTAPEVFLKALAMVRNVALQEGREVKRFTTLVCDLHDLPQDYRAEAPRGSAGYYFRPWKTMLVRTVADGGKSHYVQGPHRETVPALWTAATAD
jgi:hypothetical protein